MKYLKKILFSMLFLFIGILTVNAEEPTIDVQLWGSVVTDMTANMGGSNNCTVVQENVMLDTFKVGSDCVATGIATGNSFILIARADSGSGDGATYAGNVVASANNTSDTNVLLTEIVELIYNQNSSSTKKVKALALASDQAKGATDYVLKAGSSNNALYVYGGYAGGEMAGIKINFSQSDHKLSYSITLNESNTNEFNLAAFFSWYLVDYIMEASPNYDRAIEIVSDSTKMSKIKADFTSKYGEVKRNDKPMSIQIGLFANGAINNDIISLYENAAHHVNPPTPTPQPTEEDGEDNPHTGAFVNIFAVIALISVGIVLFLGNKRKLFRI